MKITGVVTHHPKAPSQFEYYEFNLHVSGDSPQPAAADGEAREAFAEEIIALCGFLGDSASGDVRISQAELRRLALRQLAKEQPK